MRPLVHLSSWYLCESSARVLLATVFFLLEIARITKWLEKRPWNFLAQGGYLLNCYDNDCRGRIILVIRNLHILRVVQDTFMVFIPNKVYILLLYLRIKKTISSYLMHRQILIQEHSLKNWLMYVKPRYNNSRYIFLYSRQAICCQWNILIQYRPLKKEIIKLQQIKQFI